FLVALRAADDFGLGSTERGLLLAGFGLSGVAVGPIAGRFVDTRGRLPITLTGAALCAVLVPLLGVVDSAEGLALTWLAAGAGSALIWTGLNTLTVESAPANRAGAVSFIGAWKFAG